MHELIAAHAEESEQVAIGIETDRGLWVSALSGAGFQVWAINPIAAARYRDRHHVSGAESDAGDAKVLADLVRTDRHNHRFIAGDTPDAEAIKVLARTHQSLIWARIRHGNILRSALREYYPAALEAFDSLTGRGALAILGRAPHPRAGCTAEPVEDQRSTQRRWAPTQHRHPCPRHSGRTTHPTPGRTRCSDRRVRRHHQRGGPRHRRPEPPDQRPRGRTGDTF
ncbi:hypothetical protein MHPYR_440043 [uncultured Mycobacterium sp.]|uniref:Transposase IS110-like N-terminal domain-containing protein n=1 Tax=uncultured Mycobacterium sp. TaxID=171292 RepID=A0A1Y5PN12_9MYCO|nr:hypothetical protein MHPYR_440043 [uncultured Mycobacterium sp.]